jgi:dTDP-4-amino-4,6-dideoxy-D-galactose acyltransferase
VDSDLCRKLEWDSDFWGFGCAQLLGERLEKGQLAEIDVWCGRQGITFLQYLAPVDDPTSARAAGEGGFHLVDERITLSCGIARETSHPAPPRIELRPGRAQDLEELEAIARVSHTASRYYNDPGFPRAGCDSLYAAWIQRSLEGALADIVFVPVVDGNAAGYVTCKRDAQAANKGWIGLLGVGPEAQGRGLGGALVQRAIDWFQQLAVEEVLVVTQGRNQAAQRLYRRCGFLTHDTGLWYHKWYRAPAAGDGDQRSAQR